MACICGSGRQRLGPPWASKRPRGERMPLDPRVKRFLDLLAASNPADARSATIEQRRSGLAKLMALSGPEIAIGGIEDQTFPGPGGALPVRIYSPPNAAAFLPGLVYFHGGGLVAGTVATHDSIARALSSFGAVRVIAVEYRLAPEHPFPAALQDAIAAVEYLGANAARFRVDPVRLGVCGDSAGGTLAAAACQAVVRAGRAPLALQLLICPILDYSGSTPSRRDLATGF